MIFFALHILGYIALVGVSVRVIPAVDSRRRSQRYRAMLARVTKLEAELGLGVFWAKDALDEFKPMLTRPEVPGYSSLHQYAFRCHGCEEIVVYADYDKRSVRNIRDKRHVFCNDCLPVEIPA